MKKELTFVDLFAGCGGFSEGFYKAGYKALSHIEFDEHACETLKERMRYYNYPEEDIQSAVLCKDITDGDVLEVIERQVKKQDVDIIIGGPPCQSFSSLGKAKDSNSMQNDPRNYLFESYMKILNHFLPKFFVFENVVGILSTKLNGKKIIHEIFERMEEHYNIIKDEKQLILNAAHYGVPQTRQRVIIIGVRKDLNIDIHHVYQLLSPTHYLPDERDTNGREPAVTVGAAILDLPALIPGAGTEVCEFKPEMTNSYVQKLRSENYNLLTHHVARTHNELDITRYTEMNKNRWTLGELYEQRPDLVHPKKRLFNNSYVVQYADLPGKTIIAHLYKDGNQFIHPDYKQGRTFTVREAARIQSFPDDFIFKGSRTQQFKQVGNAVPPLLAQKIAEVLQRLIEEKLQDAQLTLFTEEINNVSIV